MSPSPLSPSFPHILLQYISPPSQLTDPIPPHLLSKPLLQRHHFLHLTPDSPHDYLCWPSSAEKTAQILDLLESRPRPIDDGPPSAYPVQYSFDGEDFFAHVDLSGSGDGDGPRVVLQWDDNSGEWKYHNTDLMPFPPGSRPLLDDVLVPPSNPALVQSKPSLSHVPHFDAGLLEDGDDDDDYWNAYGSTDIGDSAYSDGVAASVKDGASSEDAYWAQYSSVHGKSHPRPCRIAPSRSHGLRGLCPKQFYDSHCLCSDVTGTADSTIPSPIPPSRRKPTQADVSGQEGLPSALLVPVRGSYDSTFDEPLQIPASIHALPRGGSRWDPASPRALSRLLSAISPRESPVPSPAPDGTFDADEVLSSPTIGGSNDSDSSSSSSSALGLCVNDGVPVVDDGPSVVDDGPSVVDDGPSVTLLPTGEGESAVDEDETDLRTALEGVWRIWKKSKRLATPASSSTAGDSEAREAFLRAARAVTELP